MIERPRACAKIVTLAVLCACGAPLEAPPAGPLDAVSAQREGSVDLPAPRFEETIQQPPTTGVIDLGQRDVRGAVIGVACVTCHRAGARGPLAARGATAAEVHGAIDLEHGAGRLSCASCHDPADRSRLRLADGRTLEMNEVVSLCGQCHGTQIRDFEHGAHGGARGYWDLSRGPRIRNGCTACHAPHAPGYPQVAPAPPPNDRLLPHRGAGGSHAGGHS